MWKDHLGSFLKMYSFLGPALDSLNLDLLGLGPKTSTHEQPVAACFSAKLALFLQLVFKCHRTVLPRSTSCDTGNAWYLLHPIQQPLVTGGSPEPLKRG